MLFCKNLEEIRWRRCGGISITMPDKSKSSDAVAATTETVSPAVPLGPPRKIYSIIKYGDPILEKPTAAITDFGPELEELTEDMFASMYAAEGGGCYRREKSGRKNHTDQSGNYSCGRRKTGGRGLSFSSGLSRVRSAAAICDRESAKRQG